MKYRKLRIAWSVGWGILAVLLCVLWVRSYYVWDWKRTPVFSGSIFTSSGLGQVCLCVTSYRGFHFKWEAIDAKEYVPPVGGSIHGFYTNSGTDTLNRGKFKLVAFPLWFATLVIATLAAFPWFCWRFSLRTLLIATTLVAVVMGLAVWLLR
jgi:hypothetical protein